jgi:titin
VTASSPSAGATDVEYSVVFGASATGGLATDPYVGSLSGRIVLKGRPGLFDVGGAAMTAYNFVVTDRTIGSVAFPGSVSVDEGGAKATLTLGLGGTVNGGDVVEVDVYGMANPSTTGESHVTVWTSSDTGAGAQFAVTPPQSVTSPEVSVSSEKAGATGVEYSVDFTASGTGRLVSDGYVDSLSGAITLSGPSGTVFPPDAGDYTIADLSSGSVDQPGSVSVAQGATSVTLRLNEIQAVEPGDSLAIDAIGVTNTTGTCAQRLVITSTSDSVGGEATYYLSCRPAAPAGVSPQSRDRQVGLYWEAADGYGSPVTDYVVDEYPGASATGTPTVLDTGGTALHFAVKNLSNGHEYTFTVTAKNALGTSDPSAPVSIVAGLPGVPPGLKATLGNDQVRLSWTAALGHRTPVTQYLINEYAGPTPTGSPEVFDSASARTTFTVTGLIAGQPYTFNVQAVNALGTGPVSGPVSLIAATVPSGSISPQATPLDQSVLLQWTPPTMTGYTPITGYKINEYLGAKATGTPAATVSTGTGSSYTVTGLTNGQEYSSTIQALNLVGASKPSTVVHATPT